MLFRDNCIFLETVLKSFLKFIKHDTNHHYCLLIFVKNPHICFMHSMLTFQNLVTLLNFVPLPPSVKWDRYERRQICFRTDCAVSSETLLRTTGNKKQRQDSLNGAILLESYAGHYYGQLIGCHSLRELTDVTVAHAKRSFHLGFGKIPINRSVLSKANSLRNPEIFEKFAFYIVSIAQAKRITKEFELHGRFYAIDSTTIDLCMSVFRWAKFRSTKSGIKIHTQIDIATEIPVFFRISHANVHDTKSMDWFIYERHACYVFDRGYFDLSRLYAIELAGAFFIIREKFHPDYEITEGEDMLEEDDNVLRDQTVRFTGKRNSGNYFSSFHWKSGK